MNKIRLQRNFVAQLLHRDWLCGTPMDFNMPGYPVLQHLPEFSQTHVHWVGDVIQPFHPLSEENQRIVNHTKEPNTNLGSEEYNRTEHSINSFSSRLKPTKDSIYSKTWHFSQKDKQKGKKRKDKMGCLSYWLKWCLMGQFWVTDNFLTRIVITQVYSLLVISALKLEFIFWS